MRQIGIIGWNGNFNIGDDAMTSVIVKYLVQSGIGNHFHFFSDIQSLANYSSKDEITEIKGIPLYGFFKKIPFIRSFLLHYIFPLLFSGNKKILLFGGGSFIHRARLSILYLRLIRYVRKKNPDVLIGAIGISIGPFKNEKEKSTAKECLEQMNFLVVRDERSNVLVREMGLNNNIKCAPDLALLLPKLHHHFFYKNGNAGNYIGLSLRHGHVTNQKLIWLSALIQSMLAHYPDYKIKLFTFCALPSENDMKENVQLFNSLPKSLQKRVIIVNYSKEPFDFYHEVYSCDIMVCMRLHAAIISYAVNTKFAIISYHQKCIDFAEEIGFQAEYILNENIAIVETVQTLKKLLEEKQNFFTKNRDEIMDQAKDHFSFIPGATINKYMDTLFFY